jgi:hypothetical protein
MECWNLAFDFNCSMFELSSLKVRVFYCSRSSATKWPDIYCCLCHLPRIVEYELCLKNTEMPCSVLEIGVMPAPANRPWDRRPTTYGWIKFEVAIFCISLQPVMADLQCLPPLVGTPKQSLFNPRGLQTSSISRTHILDRNAQLPSS